MRRVAAMLAAMMLLTSAPVAGSSWSGPIRLTWYGSDYYGHRTACGQTYSKDIVGVATWRNIPCGAIITLRWHGITVRAPVIDRMPRHPWVVFDASAKIACDLLNPPRLKGTCFTRSGVYWRRG